MINSKQAARLQHLVRKLVEAARADEMKGAQRPDDADSIEAELKMVSIAFDTFVVSITQPKDTVAVPVSIEQAQAMKDVAEGYLARRRTT